MSTNTELTEVIHQADDIWSQESVKQEILQQVKRIANMLIDKNAKYGNSALRPKRIFSRANPIEQINIRIDDKLSRIENQNENDDEDAEMDLIGYLILKRVCKSLTEREEKKESPATNTAKTVING
jgi:hypothetical protein